jgi:hypothetical protein
MQKPMEAKQMAKAGQEVAIANAASPMTITMEAEEGKEENGFFQISIKPFICINNLEFYENKLFFFKPMKCLETFVRNNLVRGDFFILF